MCNLKRGLFLCLLCTIFFISGCKSEAFDKVKISSGRATVVLSAIPPTEEFGEIIYIGFEDASNALNYFTLTLSPSNKYSMVLSIPTGEYKLSDFRTQSEREYHTDLAGFVIPEEKTYVIQSNISSSPITKTVYEDNQSSRLLLFSCFLIAGILFIAALITCIVCKKKSETFRFSQKKQ